jgi:ankyrin repeat protein
MMDSGGEERVQYLLGKGLKVPPIHLAACFGELQKVQGLLTDGVSATLKDSAGFTPLHYALGRGHKKLAELLISKGADVNARSLHDETPLMAAKTTDMTALLIAKGADVADVNIRSKSGVSPLLKVMGRGDTQQAELLISHGAEVSVKESLGERKGLTPLHRACARGYRAIIKMLLARGADINSKTDMGDTPLSLAKENKHTEIVELLRKHGAKE